MSLKKRHPIRSSKIREIKKKLKPKLGKEIDEILDGQVETCETEEGTTIVVDDKPGFIKENDTYIPLIFIADRLKLKMIEIDMGAVEPVSDGADVMAPGITNADEDIKEGEIVKIVDEKNQKILAICRALVEGSELKGNSGKVAENIHHVGDKFWDIKEDF